MSDGAALSLMWSLIAIVGAMGGAAFIAGLRSA